MNTDASQKIVLFLCCNTIWVFKTLDYTWYSPPSSFSSDKNEMIHCAVSSPHQINPKRQPSNNPNRTPATTSNRWCRCIRTLLKQIDDAHANSGGQRNQETGCKFIKKYATNTALLAWPDGKLNLSGPYSPIASLLLAAGRRRLTQALINATKMTSKRRPIEIWFVS